MEHCTECGKGYIPNDFDELNEGVCEDCRRKREENAALTVITSLTYL